MSLNDVYEVGLRHAIANIKANGGKEDGAGVTIPVQAPMAVKFEKSFDGHYPTAKIPLTWSDAKDEISIEFEGIGFVIRGDASRWDNFGEYVFNTELYVDGKLVEKPVLPVNFTRRRYELAWKYQLPKGKHTVKLKILNPSKENEVKGWDAIVYGDRPVDGLNANRK